MTFESAFIDLKLGNFAFYLLQMAILTGEILSFVVWFVIRFASKIRKISGHCI